MIWLRSIGGWIATLVMSVLAGLGAVAWWRERKRRLDLQDRQLDKARAGLSRAQEDQRRLLDDAVARGDDATAAERAATAEEVDRASRDHDLVDLYAELDAGADDDPDS